MGELKLWVYLPSSSLLPVPERLLTRSSQFKEGLHHTIVVPGLGGLFLMPSPGALLRGPTKTKQEQAPLVCLDVSAGEGLLSFHVLQSSCVVGGFVLFLFSLVHQPFRQSKLVFSPPPCPL